MSHRSLDRSRRGTERKREKKVQHAKDSNLRTDGRLEGEEEMGGEKRKRVTRRDRGELDM